MAGCAHLGQRNSKLTAEQAEYEVRQLIGDDSVVSQSYMLPMFAATFLGAAVLQPGCFYVCQATDRGGFVVRTRWICLVI